MDEVPARTEPRGRLRRNVAHPLGRDQSAIGAAGEPRPLRPETMRRTAEKMPSAPISISAVTSGRSRTCSHAIGRLLDAGAAVRQMHALGRHRREERVQVAAMEDVMRRAELLRDGVAERRLGQRAAVVPAALVEVRRAVRDLGAFLAEAEPDQDPRCVRPDIDARADLREQARLLVDLHVEAGLQQVERGGEPADAAADDRDPDFALPSSDALAAHLVVARDRGGRSPAENGASGGFIRASAGSPWICDSSAFTPDTSGLPSNSLRMVTPASSAALSPLAQASWQRSALRFAVAEMQPAKAPPRASSSTASVEGNTSKLFEIAAASRA